MRMRQQNVQGESRTRFAEDAGSTKPLNHFSIEKAQGLK
jgi:hypothetical protein